MTCAMYDWYLLVLNGTRRKREAERRRDRTERSPGGGSRVQRRSMTDNGGEEISGHLIWAARLRISEINKA